jgi:acetoacetyl-CoA synthetase
MDQPLWQPSAERIERANLTAFARKVAAAHGAALRDYPNLRAWSAEHGEEFWPARPDGSRYRGAYFERFPGVWTHGDLVELTRHDGLIIYGRSDAVLNPGGVRIGTAEIYRQVEQIPEVVEALAVGQTWQDDVRVVLFLRLAEGAVLDQALIDRIRQRIRSNCTPRHVPAKILGIADIPRTMNGKIAELAVREVIHGRPVKNVEALANPESLALYRDLRELRS